MNSAAPETIEIRRGGRTLVYRLARELVCVERRGAPGACRPVLELDDEGLVVLRAQDVPGGGMPREQRGAETGWGEPGAPRPEAAPTGTEPREPEPAREGMPAPAPPASPTPTNGLIEVRPVYRLEGGPSAFVPTGRLFVRLELGRRLGDSEEAIASLGYELERVNDWAPHSGSLRARSGSVAEALGRLEELRAGLAAESVEPELLTARR